MKKFFKIIVFIIEILICYFIIEFSCYCFEFYKLYPYIGNGRNLIEYIKCSRDMIKNNTYMSFDKYYDNLIFRPIAGEQYKDKNSIILFGCSFTNGTHKLKDNQIVSYKLSEYTKKTVYNRAQPGWGIQNMLYQLRRKDFYSIIKNKPDYVIYIYWKHLIRLYREDWIIYNQVFYKENKKNNCLEESYFMHGKFPLYSFFSKYVRRIVAEEKLKNKKNSYEFMFKHFEESKQEIEKHWNNTKFIIFVYSANEQEKEFLTRMQREGYNVIFLDDISDIDFDTVKYQISEDDSHPNELAWDTIVPLLVKYIETDK